MSDKRIVFRKLLVQLNMLRMQPLSVKQLKGLEEYVYGKSEDAEAPSNDVNADLSH